MKRVVVATFLCLAVGLGLASPASAAPAAPKAARPSASFFGVHYPSIGVGGSYPESTMIGSVRLWDTGTTWRSIQPARGRWDWTVMDRAVDKARANGASVLYVLGNTPRWAAGRPDLAPGIYGLGSSSPPLHEADWVAYVRAVATRYKGRIGAYEAWNEFNLSIFYGGTSKEMARLAYLAYRTIKSVDPKAIVTSPSITVRGSSGTRWMTRYAQEGGLRFADVLNVHLYPMPEQAPEDAVTMLRTFRRAMIKVGVRKAIWNTEMNYGLPAYGVARTKPLTTDQQAAFVLRDYLLGWSNGVTRIYWYNWSAASFLGVQMSLGGTDPSRATAAGKALATVRTWMSGKVAPCTVAASTGTYSCVVDYGRGDRGLIRWNPKHPVSVLVPKGTTSMVDHRGNRRPINAIKQRRVGEFPVLFAYNITSVKR